MGTSETLRLRQRLAAAVPGFLRPHWARLRSSSLGYRLAKGAFWSVLGAGLARGLGLCASMTVARLLGKTGFGELGIIQSTVGMFGTFAGFGLGLTATKYVAEFRVAEPQRAGRVIGLSSLVSWVTGGLMGLVLAGSAPWLATHALAAPTLAGLLRLSALLLIFGAVAGAQMGALAGFEAFRRIARVNLAAGAAAFPLLALGAWWRGVDGAVAGLVVSQGIACLLGRLALRAEAGLWRVPLGLAGAATERSILWRFSLPAVLAGVMVGPAGWVCNTFIVNQPGGYAEMGLYNAATQWRQVVLFFPTMLAAVGLPMLSNLRGQNHPRRSARLLRTNLALSFAWSAATALPIALFAQRLMACYGPSFTAGGNVLALVCVAAVLMATVSVVSQLLASEDRMWVSFGINTLWAGALIVLAYLLRERGALGLALANLLAYGVRLATVSAYLAWRLRNQRAT